MVGGGLGPLLVGIFSDQLTSQFGPEALRMSLAITTGTCFTLGILTFAWAMKAYQAIHMTHDT
jgi:hypothetical protein